MRGEEREGQGKQEGRGKGETPKRKLEKAERTEGVKVSTLRDRTLKKFNPKRPHSHSSFCSLILKIKKNNALAKTGKNGIKQLKIGQAV